MVDFLSDFCERFRFFVILIAPFTTREIAPELNFVASVQQWISSTLFSPENLDVLYLLAPSNPLTSERGCDIKYSPWSHLVTDRRHRRRSITTSSLRHPKGGAAAEEGAGYFGVTNSYSWDTQRAVSRANVYITKKNYSIELFFKV